MSFPTGQGTPIGYQQLGPWAANALTGATWASTGGGQVTFTSTTAHGVLVGQTFTVSGMTPSGYNGTRVAITGTTGSTIVAAEVVDPGSQTVLGTLDAAMLASTLLSVPKGTTMAVISVQDAGVRYRDDGGVPTALLGVPLAAGGVLTYAGNAGALRFIAQSGGNPTINVLFYR